MLMIKFTCVYVTRKMKFTIIFFPLSVKEENKDLTQPENHTFRTLLIYLITSLFLTCLKFFFVVVIVTNVAEIEPEEISYVGMNLESFTILNILLNK